LRESSVALYQERSCLGRPERWDTMSRGVSCSVATRSWSRKPGRKVETGLSQSSLPSSTRVPITNVVKALEDEPMANRVSGVTGSFFSVSR
jgi:hypothetical protein